VGETLEGKGKSVHSAWPHLTTNNSWGDKRRRRTVLCEEYPARAESTLPAPCVSTQRGRQHIEGWPGVDRQGRLQGSSKGWVCCQEHPRRATPFETRLNFGEVPRRKGDKKMGSYEDMSSKNFLLYLKPPSWRCRRLDCCRKSEAVLEGPIDQKKTALCFGVK